MGNQNTKFKLTLDIKVSTKIRHGQFDHSLKKAQLNFKTYFNWLLARNCIYTKRD